MGRNHGRALVRARSAGPVSGTGPSEAAVSFTSPARVRRMGRATGWSRSSLHVSTTLGQAQARGVSSLRVHEPGRRGRRSRRPRRTRARRRRVSRPKGSLPSSGWIATWSPRRQVRAAARLDRVDAPRRDEGVDGASGPPLSKSASERPAAEVVEEFGVSRCPARAHRGLASGFHADPRRHDLLFDDDSASGPRIPARGAVLDGDERTCRRRAPSRPRAGRRGTKSRGDTRDRSVA